MVLTVGRRDIQDWKKLDVSRPADEAFGVYVHWPFCLAKCPYCDFNSHVRAGGVDAMDFAQALKAELSWFADRTPGRRVTSVFFGGGTPSLMPPAAVGVVLDAIGRLWTVSETCEVTLEANPTSVEAGNFSGYRAAGVSRASVGVQALDDSDLKALGRLHTAEEALSAFRLAAKIFPRTSFDLIYARPGQTPAQWRSELSRALSEQRGHMSLYQLTIEPGTPFEALHERGRLRTPDEDTGTALYDLTQELTDKVGLPAYEVSNHATPGSECRHNLLYWRMGEYAGVGPGAHSRLLSPNGRRVGLSTERHPETWRSRVQSEGAGVIEETSLSGEESAEEYLLMGLRLSEGIDLARHERLAGKALSKEALAFLAGEGLIAVEDRCLKATAAGRRVLNALIAELCR